MAITKELRKLGIGGTDVAAIMGYDEKRDKYSVWAEKKGLLQRQPPNPRMLLGKYFERGIIDYYAALTGRAVEFCDVTSVHPNRPWMVYTPDALCRNEKRGVDAKFVSYDQRFKWGETADAVPQRIQLQCWWYMAALDFDAWDVAAVLSDSEPMIFTFYRDLSVEEPMLEEAEEFYQRYLIGTEVPEPGHSDDTARALRQQFPRHVSKLRQAEEAERTNISALFTAHDMQDKVTNERARIENVLKLAIGDGEGLTWPSGRVTWRTTKDSLKTDWERLAVALMKGYSDAEREALLATFTEVRAGSRRFLLQGEPTEL